MSQIPSTLLETQGGILLIIIVFGILALAVGEWKRMRREK